MHNEEKKKERLRKWYEKEKTKAEQSEYRQIKTYAERCRIDVNRCNSDTIKIWIRNLKRIEKKVEKIPINDIRRYIIM